MPEEVGTELQDPTPAPAPADNAALPAKPAIKIPPTSTELGEDADLARRYENARGQIKAYRNGMEEYTGALEQRLHTATASLNEAKATIGKLEKVVESLQGQLGEIPGLKEKGSLADNLQQQVDRLSLLMHYPQVVGAVQVKEVEKEDGTKEQVRENPVLDVLMSSSLSGDAFKASVDKFVSTLGAPPKEPLQTETGSVTPVAPATQDKKKELWDQYIEARNAGDTEAVNRLLDEYQKVKYS